MMTNHKLDLKGVACPMNFVKTQLTLDKLDIGELLEVTLDNGEPFESVTKSVEQEGHQIELSEKLNENLCRIVIRKSK